MKLLSHGLLFWSPACCTFATDFQTFLGQGFSDISKLIEDIIRGPPRLESRQGVLEVKNDVCTLEMYDVGQYSEHRRNLLSLVPADRRRACVGLGGVGQIGSFLGKMAVISKTSQPDKTIISMECYKRSRAGLTPGYVYEDKLGPAKLVAKYSVSLPNDLVTQDPSNGLIALYGLGNAEITLFNRLLYGRRYWMYGIKGILGISDWLGGWTVNTKVRKKLMKICAVIEKRMTHIRDVMKKGVEQPPAGARPPPVFVLNAPDPGPEVFRAVNQPPLPESVPNADSESLTKFYGHGMPRKTDEDVRPYPVSSPLADDAAKTAVFGSLETRLTGGKIELTGTWEDNWKGGAHKCTATFYGLVPENESGNTQDRAKKVFDEFKKPQFCFPPKDYAWLVQYYSGTRGPRYLEQTGEMHKQGKAGFNGRIKWVQNEQKVPEIHCIESESDKIFATLSGTKGGSNDGYPVDANFYDGDLFIRGHAQEEKMYELDAGGDVPVTEANAKLLYECSEVQKVWKALKEAMEMSSDSDLWEEKKGDFEEVLGEQNNVENYFVAHRYADDRDDTTQLKLVEVDAGSDVDNKEQGFWVILEDLDETANADCKLALRMSVDDKTKLWPRSSVQFMDQFRDAIVADSYSGQSVCEEVWDEDFPLTAEPRLEINLHAEGHFTLTERSKVKAGGKTRTMPTGSYRGPNSKGLNRALDAAITLTYPNNIPNISNLKNGMIPERLAGRYGRMVRMRKSLQKVLDDLLSSPAVGVQEDRVKPIGFESVTVSETNDEEDDAGNTWYKGDRVDKTDFEAQMVPGAVSLEIRNNLCSLGLPHLKGKTASELVKAVLSTVKSPCWRGASGTSPHYSEEQIKQLKQYRAVVQTDKVDPNFFVLHVQMIDDSRVVTASFRGRLEDKVKSVTADSASPIQPPREFLVVNRLKGHNPPIPVSRSVVAAAVLYMLDVREKVDAWNKGEAANGFPKKKQIDKIFKIDPWELGNPQSSDQLHPSLSIPADGHSVKVQDNKCESRFHGLTVSSTQGFAKEAVLMRMRGVTACAPPSETTTAGVCHVKHTPSVAIQLAAIMFSHGFSPLAGGGVGANNPPANQHLVLKCGMKNEAHKMVVFAETDAELQGVDGSYFFLDAFLSEEELQGLPREKPFWEVCQRMARLASCIKNLNNVENEIKKRFRIDLISGKSGDNTQIEHLGEFSQGTQILNSARGSSFPTLTTNSLTLPAGLPIQVVREPSNPLNNHPPNWYAMSLDFGHFSRGFLAFASDVGIEIGNDLDQFGQYYADIFGKEYDVTKDVYSGSAISQPAKTGRISPSLWLETVQKGRDEVLIKETRWGVEYRLHCEPGMAGVREKNLQPNSAALIARNENVDVKFKHLMRILSIVDLCYSLTVSGLNLPHSGKSCTDIYLPTSSVLMRTFSGVQAKEFSDKFPKACAAPSVAARSKAGGSRMEWFFYCAKSTNRMLISCHFEDFGVAYRYKKDCGGSKYIDLDRKAEEACADLGANYRFLLELVGDYGHAKADGTGGSVAQQGVGSERFRNNPSMRTTDNASERIKSLGSEAHQKWWSTLLTKFKDNTKVDMSALIGQLMASSTKPISSFSFGGLEKVPNSFKTKAGDCLETFSSWGEKLATPDAAKFLNSETLLKAIQSEGYEPCRKGEGGWMSEFLPGLKKIAPLSEPSFSCDSTSGQATLLCEFQRRGKPIKVTRMYSNGCKQSASEVLKNDCYAGFYYSEIVADRLLRDSHLRAIERSEEFKKAWKPLPGFCANAWVSEVEGSILRVTHKGDSAKVDQIRFEHDDVAFRDEDAKKQFSQILCEFNPLSPPKTAAVSGLASSLTAFRQPSLTCGWDIKLQAYKAQVICGFAFENESGSVGEISIVHRTWVKKDCPKQVNPDGVCEAHRAVMLDNLGLFIVSR